MAMHLQITDLKVHIYRLANATFLIINKLKENNTDILWDDPVTQRTNGHSLIQEPDTLNSVSSLIERHCFSTQNNNFKSVSQLLCDEIQRGWQNSIYVIPKKYHGCFKTSFECLSWNKFEGKQICTTDKIVRLCYTNGTSFFRPPLIHLLPIKSKSFHLYHNQLSKFKKNLSTKPRNWSLLSRIFPHYPFMIPVSSKCPPPRFSTDECLTRCNVHCLVQRSPSGVFVQRSLSRVYV